MIHENSNIEKSFNLFKKLLEEDTEQNRRRDYPYTLNLVGHMYMEGLGTNRDYLKGIELTKKGAKYGNPISVCNIGVFQVIDFQNFEISNEFEIYEK